MFIYLTPTGALSFGINKKTGQWMLKQKRTCTSEMTLYENKTGTFASKFSWNDANFFHNDNHSNVAVLIMIF